MRKNPIWRRYLRFFGPDIPADVDDELRFHLESKVEQLMQRGFTEAQARREAHRQFGHLNEYRQLCEQWARRKEKTMERNDYWLGIGNDLRYAARTLRKDWGFTLIAILILALGIGATTGVFSVIHALLLRPLPFREPERLVWIENKTDARGQENLSALTNRALTLRHWMDRNQLFENLGGYMAFFGYLGYNLTAPGSEPERLSGVPITPNFFEVLGVRPTMGRPFTHKDFPESERSIITAAAPRVAILSHGLWQRRFGGDPSILGRRITLNNGVTEIIGVMPASFDFTAIFTPGAQVDFYLPFPLSPTSDRWGNTLSVVGRLKPGISRETAQAEIDALSASYRAEHPDIFGQEGRVQGLREHISGGVRRSLLVLAGAVALVLLIVCANLSNLLLARAAARRREMAVRAALGAGRWRIVRQLLVESLMLSLSGALLGLPLAYIATQLATRIDNSRVPLLNQVAIDPWALAVAILVSLTTAILFGLAPGLTLARTDLHDTLKDSPRGSTASRVQLLTRHALVVSEVTLATMLLIGAGLLVQSFLKLMSTDPGFRPERTAIVRLDLGPDYNEPVRLSGYLRAIRQNLIGRNGVTDAGFTDALPLDRQRTWNLRAQGVAYGPKNPAPLAFVSIISPGYLEAMGIPMLAGRAFDDHSGEHGSRETALAQPGPFGQTRRHSTSPSRRRSRRQRAADLARPAPRPRVLPASASVPDGLA
jgi:putative ABC transport system permease protein